MPPSCYLEGAATSQRAAVSDPQLGSWCTCSSIRLTWPVIRVYCPGSEP